MSVDLEAKTLACQVELPGEPLTRLEVDLLQQCAAMEVPDYFVRKALPVRVLAALLLIPAGPIIGLLVILMRCTSAGPGIYAQKRVGRMGREFMMYKIRTMYQDAENGSGPTWCIPGDSRITCCGRMLRFLHLDELPQLWNIVRGEMDLIGPRPERLIFVERLVHKIPGYIERLAVLPGVTGLAQINLAPDETTDCVRCKIVLDREYIQAANWWFDLRIMACTVLRMVGIRHGLAAHWLRLHRQVSESEVSALKFESAKTCLPESGLLASSRTSAPMRVVGQLHPPGTDGSGGPLHPHAEPSLATATSAQGGNSEDSRIAVNPRKPK